MPRCQSSEDEYEDHLLHEMRYVYGGGELHYKPTRTQEKLIGYDFAVSTQLSLFPEPGVLVTASRLSTSIPQQSHWELPVRMANAFVQCKVPYYVTRQMPATTRIWTRWLSSYYRINIDTAQRETLTKVAAAVGHSALVCYAAPCFYTHSETDTFVPRGEVVTRTHFQEARLLNQRNHDVYTYQTADGVGWGFSETEQFIALSFSAEINRILNDSPVVSVALHIQKIWSLLRNVDDLSIHLDINQKDIDTAGDIIGDLADKPIETKDTDSVTFGEIVAKSLRIRRFLKTKLGVAWLSFAIP